MTNVFIETSDTRKNSSMKMATHAFTGDILHFQIFRIVEYRIQS